MNFCDSVTMEQGSREVKISFESFLQKEVQDALHWNREIGLKIMFGSKTGKYFCKECSFWDNQKANIVNHVEMKHLSGFPGYTCALCQLVFQTWFIFKSHIKKTHCPDAASTRKSLQILRDQNSKVLQAPIQKDLISTPKELDQRMRELKKKDILKKDFKAKAPKPKPVQTKPKVMSFYACGKCDDKYTQKNQLFLHYKVVHNISPVVDEISYEVPVYEYDEAKKGYSIPTPKTSLGMSQIPKRVKTESEFIPCTYCPKYFTSFSEYAEHEATHDGVYIYNCHLCKGLLGFRMEHKYIEHMNTKHKKGISSNSQNMVRCSYTHTCQRLFLSKQVMKTHILNDHFTIKTEKALEEPQQYKPLQYSIKSFNFNNSETDEDLPISFSISRPTMPIPQEDLDKDVRSKISSTVSPGHFGTLDINEASSTENFPELSSQSSSNSYQPQMETLLESSITSQGINTLGNFTSDENCGSDNGNYFEPNDPLAIEPGEVVDDKFKSETFLEETVVMC